VETSATRDRNLFSALPQDLSESLFAKSRPLHVAAGRAVFIEGEPGDGCYRVDQGLLKVSVLSASGAERILAIMGEGTVVGELSVLDGGPRSATVAAVKDSELRFIGRADFQAFAEAHPQVYKHLVMLLAQRLRTTNVAIAAASFLTLKGRVARALLDLSQAFGHDIGGGRILIRQKINQSDLAAMAGIARENVSRILNVWKRQSVVSLLAGYYCLESRETLEREAKL
jgi:CRP/FNR family transcriptional regulator, cyclic AMP receptor protein